METAEATFKVIKFSKFYKDLLISITLEGALENSSWKDQVIQINQNQNTTEIKINETKVSNELIKTMSIIISSL